jgi:hypothetical protein
MNLKKESEHAKLCLEEMVKTKIVPDSTVLDHVLLAKVYRIRRFTVFPSTFFNTEWQMNTSWDGNNKIYDAAGIGTQTESGWFVKNEYSDSLFENAFSWHWHNSSHKNNKIEEGSKFNLLQNKIKLKLKDNNIV